MIGEILQSVWIVIEIILGLGLLIFVHEFGHFLLAKKNKVKVEAFSMGFGPVLWKRLWGGTEYRLSVIPLGGYVKMAGEAYTSERSGAPDELTSKTAWQRLQIFIAGALINLVVAFPLSIIAFLAGRYVQAPIVAVPSPPETIAGMEPGDRIVEVDGRSVQSMDQYRIAVVRAPKASVVPVKVLRNGETKDLSVVQSGSEFHGVRAPVNIVAKVVRDSTAEQAGLRPDDVILAIDGQRILGVEPFSDILQANLEKTVSIRVQRGRNDGSLEELTLPVFVPSKKIFRPPQDWNLVEALVGSVSKGSPASGLLEPGDIVKRIDGKKIGGWQDMKDAVEPALRKKLSVEVQRGGELKDFDITPTYGGHGKGVLGVGWKKGSRRIAWVSEQSPYHVLGLRSGDLLQVVDGDELKSDVGENLLGAQFAASKPISIVVDRNGQRVPVTVPVEEKLICDADKLGIELEFQKVFRRWGFGEAITDGLYEPIDIGIMTFQVLGKLFTGSESVTGLSGPVGIFKVSYRSAELSLGNFLWLLVLITVNLGIFNLLPIPILDGGHVVLLAIEKLRGRAPSEKFVAIFQYTGLALLLALIIFVTYFDVMGR